MPSIITQGFAQPITVDDIFIRVKRTFGDEAGAQIENADILRWANDGQLDIARKTQCIVKTEIYNTTNGVYEVNIPPAFLFFLRATCDGRLLSPISYQELDARYPNRAETYPTGVPEYITFIGNTMYLYPAPVASGVGNLLVIYAARPAILVNTADNLEIPDRFYETLIRFCLMRAKELDGDWEAARIFQKSYEEELQGINTELENSNDSSYPVIRETEGY